MTLEEYVNQRLDEGGTTTVIEGLQNGVNCNLDQAVNNVPRTDWTTQISNRQKEADGQTLIWLAGSTDPNYSIQD